MLTILSHSTNPFTKEAVKYLITRPLLGIRRGPDAVRESLLRGLDGLEVPYRYNRKPLSGTTLVLSGVEALREAIEAKNTGKAERLIAGPNITVHPYDYNKLICDEAIDTILVPSPWTKDYWTHAAPEIAHKIIVWPAGVASAPASDRNGRPVLYNKLKDDTLLNKVVDTLATDIEIFTYGRFSRADYLHALKTAPYLVYLAESESQGLAIQEAWARDVPTLVNESHTWQGAGLSWSAPQINAPYLNDELGAVFKKPSELPNLIRQIASLHPKDYCDRELSDTACVGKLLTII